MKNLNHTLSTHDMEIVTYEEEVAIPSDIGFRKLRRYFIDETSGTIKDILREIPDSKIRKILDDGSLILKLSFVYGLDERDIIEEEDDSEEYSNSDTENSSQEAEDIEDDSETERLNQKKTIA